MSNSYHTFQESMRKILEEELVGDVYVNVDDQKDEMTIRIIRTGLDGLEEYNFIFDHLSKAFVYGKSVEDFKLELMIKYWKDAQDVLRRRMFKK